jgi:hypothetical protein
MRETSPRDTCVRSVNASCDHDRSRFDSNALVIREAFHPTKNGVGEDHQTAEMSEARMFTPVNFNSLTELTKAFGFGPFLNETSDGLFNSA